MGSYKLQADEQYKEVQVLTDALKTETVQHKRQALKGRLEVARLQWQNYNLLEQNEQLTKGGTATAMSKQVKMATYTKESAEASIKDAALQMHHRVVRMAEQLQAQMDNNRYDDLLYTMMSELPVILGNSSFDSLARMKAERYFAMQVLEMSKPTQE